ncbi:MAG TPA: M28 family peptidase, partial [Solirubrobacteraceae bacterium]
QPASRLMLSPDGPSLTLAKDWTPLGASPDGIAEGPIVFVGYGISAPELGYDDYAGVDVRDRVVLAMSGEPRRGDPTSPFARAGTPPHGFQLHKARTTAAKGARALLLVSRPDGRADGLPALAGPRAAVDIPVAAISRPVAERLLGSLAPMMRGIDAALTPASRALPGATTRLEVRIVSTPASAANVIAVLPGTDPARAHEAVVLGAHYDHLGRTGGHVHPGADDNASGTAAVLALARHFAATGGTPRTLVFALFGGEELGLLGSGAYVQHPPFPLARTVAMVNLDMVGRLRDERLHVLGVDSASGLRDLVGAAATGLGFDLSFGGDPFGPSDHQAFYRHGVPVVFLTTGEHGDYHRPTDTWEKINASGLERIVTLADRVVDRLARERAPVYARATPPRATRSGSGAFLGVAPDQGDEVPGARLSMVVPESAADRAGVRPGDVIVRFGGVRVYGFDDLRELISARKAGDRVEIAYQRDGGERTVDATLGARQ